MPHSARSAWKKWKQGLRALKEEMYGNCVNTERHSSRIVCIMGKAVDHIGEMKTMNCGEVVTIIGKTEKQNYYKMLTSDGFEFEGSYQNFKKGTINPDFYKTHIGETNTMNCGEVVTIIAKSFKKNCYKMRTSDGFEFEGDYQNFKKGIINTNYYKGHIGETNTMNCGEAVTIIGKAEKEKYYKMRTLDGFEFEGSYKNFKSGTLNPGRHKGHIGEKKTMNCGKIITIIGESKKQNYYIMRTSDGFEFEGDYQCFKRGTINPDFYKTHIGEIKNMDCGEAVTIIGKAEKENYYKMRTSDGFEFEGSYRTFKNGTINPDFYKTHIGETNTMNCGEVVTIIGKSSKKNCYRMQTSDGFEFERSYKNFKKGTINPNCHKDHTGETKNMNCGLSAKCLEYESTQKITVYFEDGYTRYNIFYSSFSKGGVLHPDLDTNNQNRNFHGYKIIGNRVNINGDVYYNAIRLSDGEKVYMTPQMMMAAEKTANEV